MTRMKLAAAMIGLGLMALVAALNVTSADTDAAQIERGKYLVERAGMCQDCHTPRNGKGEPDRSKSLQGGPLTFKPMQPVPHWRDAAPGIAGLPGWSEADAVKFLETGRGRDGDLADPPMPAYRFSHRDALAVVAYLKSLPAGK